MRFCVGYKIWFRGEKRPYTVRASGLRFLVCTKPFAARRTVLYTVVDRQYRIRGTENLIFGAGAETDEQCLEMLYRLESGETQVSHRNNVPLDITRIDETCSSDADKERLDWLDKYVEDWGHDHALGLVWDDEDGIWFTRIDHGPHTGIPIEPLRTGKSNTVREAIDEARNGKASAGVLRVKSGKRQ